MLFCSIAAFPPILPHCDCPPDIPPKQSSSPCIRFCVQDQRYRSQQMTRTYECLASSHDSKSLLSKSKLFDCQCISSTDCERRTVDLQHTFSWSRSRFYRLALMKSAGRGGSLPFRPPSYLPPCWSPPFFFFFFLAFLFELALRPLPWGWS